MTQEESPDSDDYFNQSYETEGNNVTQQAELQTGPTNENVPRPKRIACILCRKRKLKCDGTRPKCNTCSRLGHTCEYNEERKKSGPKRGYVKLLEARLKQVENMLETKDAPTNTAPVPAADPDKIMMPADQLPATTSMPMNLDPSFTDPTMVNGSPAFDFNTGDDFPWELIGLGLEEALPTQDAIDELNEIYFAKIHPSLPMIHRARFLLSMDLAPHMRPAVCLRYAMWCHAAAITSKYEGLAEHFYQRARKYAEQDEMKGHGESIITLGHCQAWTLLACYEFRQIYFPRAWMSIGRASRLALMMGLHRQDRVGLDVKQTLPPPRDWTDREERRRTFWMAYCQDRYASIGTGWPMVIDEQDILTNLPASEEAFNRGNPEQTGQLADILAGLGTDTISSFSGVILLATLYGRNLTHLHRPSDDDNDHDLNGAFWKRHRQLDNIILNISLSMPSALRLPAALSDANAVFCNMNIHTAAICLHQAAIFKADKHKLPAQISAESKRRCIVAADQVTNIMKMICHLDLSLMNPFLAFCLYVAARVFVQYLKSRKEDQTVMSALNFLLSAMHALKQKNPLTESFLVQLDVDLEGSGLQIQNQPQWKFGQRPPGEIPAGTDGVHCIPLMEIRESQSLGQADRAHGGGATTNAWTRALGPESAKTPHGPWPVDSNSVPTSDYPNLYGAANQTPPNDCIQDRKMDHLHPVREFSGDDLLYGQMRVNSQGPSPGNSNSNSNGGSGSTHSGQPTPSTSSLPYNEFSPPNIASTAQYDTNQVPYTGVGGGQQQSWEMPSRGPNDISSKGMPQQQQEQVSQGTEFNFGRTGMTPGATGMTPGSEAMWQNSGNADWMYGWGN
ncbi:putative transcriptional regulatory protein [Cyphellophora attinorum]|uniref:Putative transcriptional regulatory protein n=1 Tax=Cyphellophora attinorum TaxID=1664694 RepID=A0A0N1NZI2_9EURO|nr:putative transcriptional regulatory protein [Phialophora attinorum]KPI41952.1 putative transcriptional regulatory protein [Phialophora attinorum]